MEVNNLIKIALVISMTSLLFSCSFKDGAEPVVDVKVAFLADQEQINAREAIQFTDQSEGNPSSWEWTFEEGTPSSSDQKNPVVTFDNPGSFEVSLKVSNGTGEDSLTKKDFIVVLPLDVESRFDSDQEIVVAGESINYTDKSTNNPTRWEWTFQGGTPSSSTEENPTITYETSGVFEAILTASNDDTQNIVTSSSFVTVTPDDVSSPDTPPLGGTIFIDADIITEDDMSIFTSIESKGIGVRTMYDRRVADFIEIDAYLFEISFEGQKIEAQVNTEFSEEEAFNHAQHYSEVIGRIPKFLLKDVETLWIHDGVNLFGGGNNNLLIHVGQGELYANDGILEEVFVHEACHTSLDAEHSESSGWKSAQSADPTFISTYAQANPLREDIAESFLPYFAVRFKSDKISEDLRKSILATIPNRIKYFNEQFFEY